MFGLIARVGLGWVAVGLLLRTESVVCSLSQTRDDAAFGLRHKQKSA